MIDERVFIDLDLGGDTRRLALTAQAAVGPWETGAYFLDYDFRLFSNFTYLLEDPLLGDEFEQRDRRNIWDAWVQGDFEAWLAGRRVIYRWGGELRFDDINEVGLHATRARQRIGTTPQDRVRELSVGAYGEAEVSLTERLRTVLGLRADHYDWDVSATRPKDSGAGNDRLISPAVNLAYHYRRFELKFELFNVLDSSDDDIAYYYESRLAGEPTGVVSDFHFHPLEPRTLRATVALHL